VPGGRVGVDHRAAQLGHVVGEPVLGVVREPVASVTLMSPSMSRSASACREWPIQRIRTPRTAVTPGVASKHRSATEEPFTAPASDVERPLYGVSTLVCLSDALSHRPRSPPAR
jgi:hypothetical protein